jgi:hypothetical protein
VATRGDREGLGKNKVEYTHRSLGQEAQHTIKGHMGKTQDGQEADRGEGKISVKAYNRVSKGKARHGIVISLG